MCGRQSGLSDELTHILQELTTLNRHDNAKVALRARQVCLFFPSLFFFVCLFLARFSSLPSSLLFFFLWNGLENKLHNETNLNSFKSALTLSSGFRDLR